MALIVCRNLSVFLDVSARHLLNGTNSVSLRTNKTDARTSLLASWIGYEPNSVALHKRIEARVRVPSKDQRKHVECAAAYKAMAPFVSKASCASLKLEA